MVSFQDVAPRWIASSVLLQFPTAASRMVSFPVVAPRWIASSVLPQFLLPHRVLHIDFPYPFLSLGVLAFWSLQLLVPLDRHRHLSRWGWQSQWEVGQLVYLTTNDGSGDSRQCGEPRDCEDVVGSVSNS